MSKFGPTFGEQMAAAAKIQAKVSFLAKVVLFIGAISCIGKYLLS
jgi:hypothetical protein